MKKSYLSIYSALLANLLIAVTKFVAGSVSNSSAMISEGIHSLVGTVNELLLLWGIRQSNRPGDASRPFGHGRELFFWSFIVSILIFGLGGGISIYQGIIHMLHPEALQDPFWSYIVLAVSLFFEGISLYIAAKEFNSTRNGRGWWQTVVSSKNPAEFLVLFEDGAAVIGLLIVMACVWIGHSFNIPWLDGLASLLVGLLLVVVSLVLARESRSLLMGEGVANETRLRIKVLTETDNATEKLLRLFSIYVGPEEVLLMMDVQFKTVLSITEVHDATDRIRQSIQTEFPKIKYLIIQPDIKS